MLQMKFLHEIRMDKTNTQTKSEPNLTIFEGLKELLNFGISKNSKLLFHKT